MRWRCGPFSLMWTPSVSSRSSWRATWWASGPIPTKWSTCWVHGAPRHIREGVLPWLSDDELEAMFATLECRLAFTGHTHRPVIRDLPRRRLVNVGSVGLPLDRDSRAAYVIAAPDGGGVGDWS